MRKTQKQDTIVRGIARAIAIVIVVSVTATACSSAPRAKEAKGPAADEVGRPVVVGAEMQNLQASLMALADTSMQRIAANLNLTGGRDRTPQVRSDDTNTRLILSSALLAIAMEPHPVDGLADMLTHTTLTVAAQRNAAKDKPADSVEARLLRSLEQNDADAWRLAERWVNEPTRVAFRQRILAWPGPRTSAAAVAFVKLSDIQRAGATSVDSGDGMFDALHATAEQLDETRLFAERSLFLAQRLPFLVRWQAEVYTANALATKEAQQTQAQLEEMTTLFAGMADQMSKERQATLADLFGHIATERKASLDQVLQIVQQERKATLAETSAAIDAQREAIMKDVLALTDAAQRTGGAWIGRSLLIGTVLIVFLLLGLLGTMLLYRRLAPRIENRALAARG